MKMLSRNQAHGHLAHASGLSAVSSHRRKLDSRKLTMSASTLRSPLFRTAPLFTFSTCPT